MSLELTVEALKAAKFRGPTQLVHGSAGMAKHYFECVRENRFGYFWERKNRQDRGRQAYTVDGAEVADLDEACRLLALPIDPKSPLAEHLRMMDEFDGSPHLNYGASRAISESHCNADVEPFSMVRVFMQRAGNAWHGGINVYADRCKEAGGDWPQWLYMAKTAAFETYRAMYLFADDRKEDTGLRCALGMRCRDCLILQTIEKNMIESRSRSPFPSNVTDSDIDAAKLFTCSSHIQRAVNIANLITPEGFFSTEESRKGL